MEPTAQQGQALSHFPLSTLNPPLAPPRPAYGLIHWGETAPCVLLDAMGKGLKDGGMMR